MASTRRKRIVVLFTLTVMLAVLVTWEAALVRAESPRAGEHKFLMITSGFLLLILALAGVGLHLEQRERREAEAQWRTRAIEMQQQEKKRREELAIAMDALQKRFAASQRIEEALRESEHRVRQHLGEMQVLSRRLMEAQETERRRVARELHDEIGQVLTAVKINLQSIQRSAGPGEPVPRLQESIEIVDRAMNQVRNLSLELRPAVLDDLGLAAAVRWYVDRQAGRAGLQAQTVVVPPTLDVSPELATACFRIVQEALTNIIRHARARQVNVEIRQGEDSLEVTIQDDGSGFDLPSARRRAASGTSLGLIGMEERALLLRGRMAIRTAPGEGTRIHVSFPLSPRSPPADQDSKRARA